MPRFRHHLNGLRVANPAAGMVRVTRVPVACTPLMVCIAEGFGDHVGIVGRPVSTARTLPCDGSVGAGAIAAARHLHTVGGFRSRVELTGGSGYRIVNLHDRPGRGLSGRSLARTSFWSRSFGPRTPRNCRDTRSPRLCGRSGYRSPASASLPSLPGRNTERRLPFGPFPCPCPSRRATWTLTARTPAGGPCANRLAAAHKPTTIRLFFMPTNLQTFRACITLPIRDWPMQHKKFQPKAIYFLVGRNAGLRRHPSFLRRRDSELLKSLRSLADCPAGMGEPGSPGIG